MLTFCIACDGLIHSNQEKVLFYKFQKLLFIKVRHVKHFENNTGKGEFQPCLQRPLDSSSAFLSSLSLFLRTLFLFLHTSCQFVEPLFGIVMTWLKPFSTGAHWLTLAAAHTGTDTFSSLHCFCSGYMQEQEHCMHLFCCKYSTALPGTECYLHSHYPTALMHFSIHAPKKVHVDGMSEVEIKSFPGTATATTEGTFQLVLSYIVSV